MDVANRRWPSLALTSVLLVGSFSYLQTLLFRPKMLTAYLSGDALLMSVEAQTLITVAFIVLSCVLGAAAIRRRTRIGTAALRLSCAGLPLACSVLLATTQAPFVPLTVSVLLGVSCASQMQLNLKKRPFDARSSLDDYVLSALISLCLSSLLSHGGYVFAQTDAEGSLVLACIMTVTGCAICLVRATPSGQDEPSERAPGDAPLRWKMVAKSVAPILPAGIICSISLGMSLHNDLFEEALRAPGLFALGIALTVAVLLVLFRRWRERDDERDAEIVLAMAVPATIGILASFLAGVLDLSTTFVLLVCSNLLLLSLTWVEVLHLYGRKALSSSALPFLSIILLLVAFAAGMTLSAVVPTAVANIVVPIAALAYLVFLVFHSQRELEYRPREQPSDNRLSYDLIRESACRSMGEDFRLSAKETEVLALLVTGISAPAIGKRLFISHETVKTHKYHIYQKMGVHNFEEAVDVFHRYADQACEAEARP